MQDGDTLVAHNIYFDMEQTLARTARTSGLDSPALQKVLHNPRFCTKRCAYSRGLFGQPASLAKLCGHFQVPYEASAAHDATCDTGVLAQCVAEAWRRGVML